MIIFAGKPVLPRRPHLDHLRKQAKVRLAELRVSRPDACLADAQLRLAQDYGFSSWGTLRAEVFRRAAAPLAGESKTRPRRTPRPARYREREHLDSAWEQASHADAQAGFFLPGAEVHLGILFVIVAVFMSLWVFSSALPGQ